MVSVTFSISLWRQTGRKKPVSRLDLEGAVIVVKRERVAVAGGGGGRREDVEGGWLFEALHRMRGCRLGRLINTFARLTVDGGVARRRQRHCHSAVPPFYTVRGNPRKRTPHHSL